MKINDVADERKKLVSVQFVAHKLNQTVDVVDIVVVERRQSSTSIHTEKDMHSGVLSVFHSICGFSINLDLLFIIYINTAVDPFVY